MKLVIIANAPLSVWRGVEQFVDHVATDFVNRGMKVEVFTRTSNLNDELAWARSRTFNYRYKCLKLQSLVYNISASPLTYNLIFPKDADAYYVTFLDPVFLSFLSLVRRPVMLGLHGVTDINGRGLKILKPVLGTFRNSLIIQALNRAQERFFRRLGYKVVHIPLAVPVEKLVPALEANKDFSVWFPSMERSKGADRLIELARLSKSRLPGVRYLVTGSGNLEEEVRLASKQLGNITVMAKLSEDQLVKVYARSSLFLCLSRSESFSLAAAEAQANGLPAIATPTDGLRDIITDNSLGVLMDYDANRYLEIIGQYHELWKSSRKKYIQIKETIAAKQRTRLSWNAMLDRLESSLLNLS